MKKIIVYLSLLSFCIMLCSCEYGLNQFFYRDNEANSRSPKIVDLNAENKAPNIGTHSNFSVLVISDVHFGRGSKDDNARYETEFFNWLTAKKAACDANAVPILFCICLGDSTETGKSADYNSYANFTTELKNNYGLTVYSIVGNHDLMNSGWSKWKQMVYPYVSSYSFVTTQGSNKISWYFLDSGNGTLGYKQLTDCKEEMLADPNTKIVFTHYPIYAGGIFYYTLQNETERDTLLSTFAKSNVTLVLEGHYHEGGSYQFGSLFSEEIIKSYLDYRNAGILTVDLSTKKVTIEQFSF